MAARCASATGRNPYFTISKLGTAFGQVVLDGLARLAPDGSYLPVLAAEIPTQANGDVSTDGTIVTWRLKPGLTWSDGQPFTSQDVVLTYQMIIDPANPVVNQRGDYTVMDTVTARDDNTAVVTYKQLYAPYRQAFPSIFPAHVFNGHTSIAQDPFNRAPTVGTGPFIFKSWAAGDSITFERNPNYRESGKPYLDEMIVKFVPSIDAEIQALVAGDIDAAPNLDMSDLVQLGALPDVSVDPVPYGVMNLYINTSCSSGPQQGDPTCPNAVLGDLRVRQALDLGLDRQALVHGLLADRVKPATSLLPSGAYAVDLPPPVFNPDAARKLLDQAGWVVGTDGIRSKDGVRAPLTFYIASGDPLGEQAAQLIEGNLQDVGIETGIKQLSAAVLSGGFPTNSPTSLGNYDLDTGSMPVLEPQSPLHSYFASDQVPNPQLQTGNNWTRVQDSRLDQALAAAGNTLDDAQSAAYLSFSELLQADEVVIPLYPLLEVDARRSYVGGWQSNGNKITWNIQDWWLNQ